MHADASAGHMAFSVQMGSQSFYNIPNTPAVIDSALTFLTPIFQGNTAWRETHPRAGPVELWAFFLQCPSPPLNDSDSSNLHVDTISQLTK